MWRPMRNAGVWDQASISRASSGRTRSGRRAERCRRGGGCASSWRGRGVVVEAQCPGERVEHLLRGMSLAALLEPHDPAGIAFAVAAPPEVNVAELIVLPTRQG
jgi:hypothetical protein